MQLYYNYLMIRDEILPHSASAFHFIIEIFYNVHHYGHVFRLVGFWENLNYSKEPVIGESFAISAHASMLLIRYNTTGKQ